MSTMTTTTNTTTTINETDNQKKLAGEQAPTEALPKPPAEDMDSLEAVGAPPPTYEILPFSAIGESGVMALADGTYSQAIEGLGVDLSFMSELERYSHISSNANYLGTTLTPLHTYAYCEPGNADEWVDKLEVPRPKETNPHMIVESYGWADYFKLRSIYNRPTRRNFIYATGSIESDLVGLDIASLPANAGSSSASSSNNRKFLSLFSKNKGKGKWSQKPYDHRQEEKLAHSGYWEKVKRRWQVGVLGKDPALLNDELATTTVTTNKKGKSAVPRVDLGERPGQQTNNSSNNKSAKGKGKETAANRPVAANIPPAVVDNLQRRGASLADNLGAGGKGLLDGPEIEKLLTDLFNSEDKAPAGKAGRRSRKKRRRGGVGTNWNYQDSLDRIGNFTFEEYPEYIRLINNSNSNPTGASAAVDAGVGASSGQAVYVGCLYISGFPRYSYPGQFDALIKIKDIRLAFGGHFEPLSPQKAASELKKKEQVFWVYNENRKSPISDPEFAYQRESGGILRNMVARNEGRIFKSSIVLSVRASSRRQLELDLRRVKSVLQDGGFEVASPRYNQRRAFWATLPIGYNPLSKEKFFGDRTVHTNLTNWNVACLLPNIVPNFTDKGGIALGDNRSDSSFVVFNRWIQPNPHSFFVAGSGGGKSLSILMEIVQEMLFDPELEAIVIDPIGEGSAISKFAKRIGGLEINLGKAGSIINCMDRYIVNGKPETLGERLDYIKPYFELMIGQSLHATTKDALSQAFKKVYRHFEDGASMITSLRLSYLRRPRYAPIRELVDDLVNVQTGQVLRPGIISRLQTEIYPYFREKYKVLAYGRVAPNADGLRPRVYLQNNRWYYGGGEWISESEQPWVDPTLNLAPGALQPAPVYYPEKKWISPMWEEFEEKVSDSGIFDALDDDDDFNLAVRDAFVELKAGMPILSDLLPFLAAQGATDLASNLEDFCDPEVYGLSFNGFTAKEIAFNRRFISFNTRDLTKDFLRAIKMFEVINLVGAIVRGLRKRRMFVCDEFSKLSRHSTEIPKYMLDFYQAGRFDGLAMTLIAQNIASILDNPEAAQCAENASRRVLLRQEKEAIGRLAGLYDLTTSQVALLLKAKPGQSLQIMNERQVQVQYRAPQSFIDDLDTRLKVMSDQVNDNHNNNEGEGEDEDDSEYLNQIDSELAATLTRLRGMAPIRAGEGSELDLDIDLFELAGAASQKL